mgnify:CR=1 FL=1|tara:strand:+ start:805 stop:1968 length:1164 start_codon:yes stop_codon:yes gene_type:complete
MSQRPTYSLDEIKSMLVAQLDGVVAQYAPPAKGSYTAFGKYFTLNPGRADRSVGSFCVTMTGPDAGRWNDYAVGSVPGKGYGDVLDLIALALDCDLSQAVREARSYLGLQSDSPQDIERRKEAARKAAARRAQAEADDRKRKNARAKQAQAIWLGGQERIKDTPVEFYLRDQRCIDLRTLGRQPRVLRYVPECFYYHEDPQTGEVFEGTYPAMVAIITNHRGDNVAVHRTYLARDADGRWNKAPVPAAKKVLGEYHGAAIHIWKGIGLRGGKPGSLRVAPQGTHLFMAEGIEDALSIVMLKPEARVLAAISLGNLGFVQLPPAVTDLTLVADLDDNDTAREQLERAVAQHQKAGRRVKLFQNRWGGKDLNDALRATAEAQHQGKEAG